MAKEGFGYIYILKNQQWKAGVMPWTRYYKVGETSRTPEDRLSDYKTYSPYKTEIVFSMKCRKRITAEKAIHLVLSPWHMSEGGGIEFFKTREGKIISMMKKVIKDVEDGIIYMQNGRLYCNDTEITRDNSSIVRNRYAFCYPLTSRLSISRFR